MDDSAELNFEFEESQVLWAKIRGYPWWPAYVSEVHPEDLAENFQYTVIFFGDNTKSRLGPSKLRKHLQFFRTFCEKMNQNRKLKMSINKAIQRLKQNHQDTTVYQQIMDEVSAKKKKNRPRSQQKNRFEDKNNKIPALSKNKTQQPQRGRKRIIMQDREVYSQKNEQSKSVSEQQIKSSKHITRQRKSSRKAIDNSVQGSNEASHNIERSVFPTRSTRNRGKQNNTFKKNMEDQQEEDDLSLDEQSIKKQSIKVQTKRGRKGRPRKDEMKARQIKESQSEKQFSVHSEAIKRGRRKVDSAPKLKGRKPFARKLAQKQNMLNAIQTSTHVLQDVQKVRHTLDNRNQLVKLLSTMNITTSNIKQILDLGITDVLLKGTITKTIFILLNSLKATLLHKYFPQDSKHRKKHEKLNKQKKKIKFDDLDDNQNQKQEKQNDNDDNQQESYAENNNNKNDNSFIIQQGLQGLRQKTRCKLQKMIRLSGIDRLSKTYAVRIQQTFQQKSIQDDIRYKEVALVKMREFKNHMRELINNKVEIGVIKKYIGSLIGQEVLQEKKSADQEEQQQQDCFLKQAKKNEQEASLSGKNSSRSNSNSNENDNDEQQDDEVQQDESNSKENDCSDNGSEGQASESLHSQEDHEQSSEDLQESGQQRHKSEKKSAQKQ